MKYAIMKKFRGNTWKTIASGFKTEIGVKNRISFLKRNNPRTKFSMRKYF